MKYQLLTRNPRAPVDAVDYLHSFEFFTKQPLRFLGNFNSFLEDSFGAKGKNWRIRDLGLRIFMEGATLTTPKVQVRSYLHNLRFREQHHAMQFKLSVDYETFYDPCVGNKILLGTSKPWVW